MSVDATPDVETRLRACSELLPERLRAIDVPEIYRILLLDSTGEVIPATLMDSPAMMALEAEGLMHAIYRENHHVGVSIEQFHGYRGDANATALLNRLREAIGEPSVVRRR